MAVAAGLIDLGDRARVASLPATMVKEALARIRSMLEEGVDRMKTEVGDAPLIAVGGGSFLVPERLTDISEILNVPHQAVAAGANRETLTMVEVEDLPLSYLPGNSLRTRVRVVGDIAGLHTNAR